LERKIKGRRNYTIVTVFPLLVVKVGNVKRWYGGDDSTTNPSYCTNDVSSSQGQTRTREYEDGTDQAVSGDNSKH